MYAETQMDFTDEYLFQLLATIELFRKGNKNGVTFSNTFFGWQSEKLPLDGIFSFFIENLTNKCESFAKNIKNFKYSKAKVNYFWANINYEGDVNWPHRHSRDLSGVFYLQTPKNSGHLLLQTPSYDLNNKVSAHMESISQKLITPKKNKLVLFDSGCWHSVTKSFSKKPRISISFNAEFYH